jgi:hypothetical protein
MTQMLKVLIQRQEEMLEARRPVENFIGRHQIEENALNEENS